MDTATPDHENDDQLTISSVSESLHTSGGSSRVVTDDRQRVPLSVSVRRALAALQKESDAEAVSSWQLAQAIATIHPDYADRLAGTLIDESGPAGLQERSLDDWADWLATRCDRQRIGEIHARLAWLLLANEDAALRQWWHETGFLAAVWAEHFEYFPSLLHDRCLYGAEHFACAVLNQAKTKTREGGRKSAALFITPHTQFSQIDIAVRKGLTTSVTSAQRLPRYLSTIHHISIAASTATQLNLGDYLSSPEQTEQTNRHTDDSLRQRLTNWADSSDMSSSQLTRQLASKDLHQIIDTGNRLIVSIIVNNWPTDADPADLGLGPADLAPLAEASDRIILVIGGVPAGVTITCPPGVEAANLSWTPAPRQRGQRMANDLADGEDRLGIQIEAETLADAIASRDMTPPLVVGIFGGWGSGKSFVLNLIERRLAEIRRRPVQEPYGETETYVGHPYLITFDAWTYAKGDLWASLMQRIIDQLDRQLAVEELLRTISHERTDQPATGAIWTVAEALAQQDVELLRRIDQGEELFRQLSGQIDQGRANGCDVLGSILNRAGEANVAKQRQDQQNLELVRVRLDQLAEHRARTLLGRELLDRLSSRIEQELGLDWSQLEGLVTDDHVKDASTRPHIDLPGDRRTWLLLAIFACATIALAALILHHSSTLASLTTVIAGALASWRGAIGDFNRRLGTARDWLQQALDQEGTRLQELKTEEFRQAIATRPEQHNAPSATVSRASIQKESDLARLMQLRQRLEHRIEAGHRLQHDLAQELDLRSSLEHMHEDGGYENRLSMLHQVKLQLDQLSRSLLRITDNDRRRLRPGPEATDSATAPQHPLTFDRGEPRIILVIDDLDRCPPEQVVEVFEATQLLVKTKLFVVLLAIDLRYVTRALEARYPGILTHDGSPSGLDYIEKIVQIPYRVRPVQADQLPNFFQHLFPKVVDDEAAGRRPASEVAAGERDHSSPKDDEQAYRLTTLAAPETTIDRHVLSISRSELNLLGSICGRLDLAPRSVKRIANVFKLWKVVWHRRDEEPTEPIKGTMIALLALGAQFPTLTRRLLLDLAARLRSGQKQRSAADNTDSLRQQLLQSLEPRTPSDDATTDPVTDTAHAFLADEQIVSEQTSSKDLGADNVALLISFSFVGDDEH